MIDTIDRAIANAHEMIATLTKLKKAYMIAELLGVPPLLWPPEWQQQYKP